MNPAPDDIQFRTYSNGVFYLLPEEGMERGPYASADDAQKAAIEQRAAFARANTRRDYRVDGEGRAHCTHKDHARLGVMCRGCHDAAEHNRLRATQRGFAA